MNDPIYLTDLRIALAAETGGSGGVDGKGVPDGWQWPGTGDQYWYKWAGPTSGTADGEPSDYPLLRVVHEHVGWWKWEVHGTKGILAQGNTVSAWEGMQLTEHLASGLTREQIEGT